MICFHIFFRLYQFTNLQIGDDGKNVKMVMTVMTIMKIVEGTMMIIIRRGVTFPGTLAEAELPLQYSRLPEHAIPRSSSSSL